MAILTGPKAELPDMTREDIDITVDNGTLTIKGEKKLATDVREDSFHRVERRYGTFSRSFCPTGVLVCWKRLWKTQTN